MISCPILFRSLGLIYYLIFILYFMNEKNKNEVTDEDKDEGEDEEDLIVTKFVQDNVITPHGGYLAALDKDFENWVDMYKSSRFKVVNNFFTDSVFLNSCDQRIFKNNSVDYCKHFIANYMVSFYNKNNTTEQILKLAFDTDEGYKKKIELYNILIHTRKQRLLLLRDYMGDVS